MTIDQLLSTHTAVAMQGEVALHRLEPAQRKPVLDELLIAIQHARQDPSLQAARQARVAGMFLSRYGNEAVGMVPTLASYIGNPQMPEPVITGAQNALSGMGMDAATALRSLLMDPQQQVRFAALQVYRLMHPLPPDALPFLVPVLSDSHPTLRNNAIELLHGQGPTGYEILERAGIAPTGNAAPTISAHASFGELIMHLDSTDPVTRAQACAMLNQHTDYPQAAPLLQKAVISDPDPPVRRCAITGLIARAKWNEALSETYRQALLDTDSEVRAEACRAFQRAPLLSPAVIEDLFTFFEKDRAIALSSTTYRGSYVAARDALMRHATPETRARLESIERTAIPIGISQPSAVNTATPSPVSPSPTRIILWTLLGIAAVSASIAFFRRP